MRTRSLVVGLLALVSGVAHTQARDLPLSHWQHTTWTGRSGPPILGLYRLLQSPDGYLWLSSYNCLMRFDGVRFTVLDSTVIPELRTTTPGEFAPMLIDRSGTMWIAGPSGARITYKDGRFKRAFTLEASGQNPVAEDDRGLIWVVGGKLQRFENGALSPMTLPPSVPRTGVWYAMSDTGGGLWIGTRSQGLWHVSRAGAVRQIGRGEIRPLIQSRDGTLWALGMGLKGISRLDGDRWIPLARPGDSAAIYSRFAEEDRDGAVWFQTNAQGVLRYHKGNVQVFSKRNGLSDDNIADVQVDPSGAVWVSTEVGLDRIRPAAFAALDPMHTISPEPGSLFARDTSGAMWMSARPSTSVLRVDGGIVRQSRAPLSATTFPTSARQSTTLIGAAQNGGAWLQQHVGDLIYLKSDGTQQRFGARAGLPSKVIHTVIETPDGSAWIRWTEGGFGRLRRGKYKPVAVAGVDDPRITGFVADTSGRVWVASRDTRFITAFAGDSVAANIPLPPLKSPIQHLAVEGVDTLWATSTQSVVRITKAKVVEVNVRALQQVLAPAPSVAVAHGSLWLASPTGIARVSLDELHRAVDGDSTAVHPQLFDALDGLALPRAAGFTPRPILATPDGRVWISTADGLFVANPATLTVRRDPPRVLIEEVAIGGRITAVSDGATIAATPDRVDIHFSATGLALPERARLQYRLDGADRDWVNASIPRVATYSQLRPGNYTFRVRAWNENGIPSARDASLRFRVPPAWYQAWWFFGVIAAAIAAVAAVAAVVWQRERSRVAARQAQARFDATLAERGRIARELHDTLLQGFTGITLQLESVRGSLEERDDPTTAELSMILDRADTTLREAREMVWDMRSPELSDTDLAAALEASTRRVLNGDDIQLRHTVSGTRRRLPPAIEAVVLRIGREAVVNSLKHAQPSAIEVRLAYEARRIVLDVSDDGLGANNDDMARAPATGHWGLAGMRERAQRAGGTFAATTAPGRGMRINVSLPAEPMG